MRLKAQIMDEAAVNRALMRISHEICEKNRGVENVVLAGILRRGRPLAERICANIEKIEGLRVPCGSIDIRYYRDERLLGRQVRVYVPETGFRPYYMDVEALLPETVEH